MKKLFATFIVVAMLCMSCAIGVSVTPTVQAGEFIVPIGSGLPGTFQPNDMVWNTAGTVALAVGNSGGATTPVWWYEAPTDTWHGVTVSSNSQIFYGVDYDPSNDLFWVCGNTNGPNSLYNWPTGDPGLVPPTPSVPTNYFKDVAVDDLGNVFIGGYHLGMMYYYVPGNTYYLVSTIGGPLLSDVEFNGVDWNPVDGRFYAVGDYMGSSAVYTTDPRPLTSHHCYWDNSGFSGPPLKEIAWNPIQNYGLAVGGEIYKLTYDGNVNYTFEYGMIAYGGSELYYDVAWDTDGWNEAAIVGADASDHGAYWRFYDSPNFALVKSYSNMMTGIHLKTCAFKPPASPKWVMILNNGGSSKANIMANDQSTQVRVNAAFPHIFQIGFWDQSSGFPGPSLLNTQVDVNNDYTFYVESNYTVGGIENWPNVELNLTAWYDGGVIGAGTFPDNTFSSDDARTRQFRVYYNVGNNTAWMDYPLGAPDEFSIHSWYEDPTTYNPGVFDQHRIYINVTFEAQTYEAAGDGIWNFPVGGNLWDPNTACNDLDSWNFAFGVYDAGLPSGAINYSFEEFGINEAVAISVTGNPTANAPPGSFDIVCANPSQVTYSSNRPYWVNVSLVDDLRLNGIPAGPSISANWIAVANSHLLATPATSDIDAGTFLIGSAFTAAGVEQVVWGTSAPTPLPTPLNGTVAGGPWGSNYNAPGYPGIDVTQVDWWATVPAGTQEGVYWTTITFTIEDWPL